MMININKRSGGSTELSVAECIDQRMQTWRIRADFKPVLDENGKQTGVTFVETQFPYKPSLQEVKDYIYAVIDAQTDEKILTGFVWGESSVWLSTENQFNYKAAFDLAVQTNGQNLPVVFKFGSTDAPVYHTFTELSELQSFYVGAVSYINQTLAEGWQKKDNFDFTPYEAILNPAAPEE